jgi:nucleoside 2-deoxyribosyltransferase-like protein
VITVYPASKSCHAWVWQALRAAGIGVVATWPDWKGNHDGHEPTADAWRKHWNACISEASMCDVLLFVSRKGEQACGALIEMGAALACGAQVFIVSDDSWSVSHHPRCRVLPDLEAAITALVAMSKGEKSRQLAMVQLDEVRHG